MTNLNQKMNTVLTALNERLAERSELLRDMAVALLTGSNLFILGQNGPVSYTHLTLPTN